MDNLKDKLTNEAENQPSCLGAVMPRYFYQDGSDVKKNDIVFYSEDGGNHKFHYADSIGMIVKRGNDLKMKAYVITMDDAKTFQDYEEPEDNMVSLKYGCENYYPWNKNLPNTLQYFTKIGKYPKDKKMLSAEYAMEHYVYNGAERFANKYSNDMGIKNKIEEILLTDYQYIDCYTVDKLLDLFAVSGRSELLVNFLLYLNEKGLINNHDFDYEKEAKKYLKKLTNCQ